MPAGHPPVPELRDQVANDEPACAGMFKCTLAFVGDEALLFNDSCFGVPASPGTAPKADKRSFEPIEYCRVLERWVLADGKWGRPAVRPSADTALDKANRAKGYAEGRIEVRPVQRRQVFVGGVPVGEAFE
ncbi:hypothetical protein HZY97_01465 [Sphingomonas sp. R-74633]|uniref:hypothetical protein n=1 Tax=Sphingomonas sp. R-74633 TaxID=2751188 RepID=UPI0015D17816|nr:hypothetical protein [Sphingomonas sp. R-74633]NYT39413.1 hypothetical protein [Sphingomonas sp. R-74633]